MNTRILLATLGLVASVSFAAPASAAAMLSDVQRDVEAATSNFSSQINVSVNDDTVTLSGAASPLDHNAAVNAALNSPGVENVVNHISVFHK